MTSSRSPRAAARLGIASALTLFLGACGGGFSLTPSSGPAPEPAVPPEVPATIRPDELVGKWGLAAYNNPNDRARTEKMALAQCKQPYTIGAGSSGGVIMHLADQATPQELRIKGSASGKNYIGPAGPPGDPQDREVISFDGRVLITRFVDPGCGDPLSDHGLCPLRAAGLSRAGRRENAPEKSESLRFRSNRNGGFGRF